MSVDLDEAPPATAGTLGEAIYWLRNDRRVTLRQLGRAMGVSAPFLSDVEHGRRQLSDANLAAAAAFLRVDVAELEARCGYTRDLGEWVKSHRDLIKLLRESRRTGRPLVIGGERCR